MNLSGDFDKSAVRVQVLADQILIQRLDPGQLEASFTKKLDGPLDKLAANALTAQTRADRHIRDVPDASFAIEPSGDVADDLAVLVPSHEDRGTRHLHVVVNVPPVAPAPFVAGDLAETQLNVLVD